MKYLKFIKLVKESANGTPNVRVCIQPLENDIDYPELDKISSKVDSIIALIQTQIDKGLYCKENEYLLLYDFQALNDGQTDLYKINAVIKPKLEIDETHIIQGKPFELIVNVVTNELTHKSESTLRVEWVSKSQFLQQVSNTSALSRRLYSILIQTFLGKQPTVSMISHSFQIDASLLHAGSDALPEGLEERRMVKRLNALTQEFQTITLKEDGVKAWLSKQEKMLPSLFLTFIKDLKSKSLDEVNSKRMPNIRVSTKSCRVNGVYQVPYYILVKMDCIMALIQAQIDKGLFCKKNQFLLLYNFQPLQAERFGFYSIDMVIKPISKISETDVIEGQSLQLVVNGITGEVMNNTKGMVELGLISQSQLSKQGLELPTSYGNYHQYAKTSDIAELIKIKHKPLLNGTVHIKEKAKIQTKPLTFSVSLTPSSPTNKNLCILIVEDNIVNQKLISKILKGVGFLHYIADNGKKAIEFYTKLSIDVILMDVEMPVMNGLEATEMIRDLEKRSSSQKERTVIIGLSGNTNQQDIDKALQVGMDGYLAKPSKREVMLETINDLMNKHSQTAGRKYSN